MENSAEPMGTESGELAHSQFWMMRTNVKRKMTVSNAMSAAHAGIVVRVDRPTRPLSQPNIG